jgi:hypothetical protein
MTKTDTEPVLSKNELLKAASPTLAGAIATTLADEAATEAYCCTPQGAARSSNAELRDFSTAFAFSR